MANIALLPNNLILTRFCSRDKRLTITSREYLLALFSQISPEDKADESGFKEYRFVKSELRAKFGFSKSVFYSDLYDFCIEVAGYVFNVSENRKNLKTKNIEIENNTGDSYLTVRIHKDLLILLTDINKDCEGYTPVNVDKYISFLNEYTKAFYVHLSDRRIELDKTVEYTEEQIREILDVKDKYSNFKDVLYYGLRLAQSEMMSVEAPDIYFTYEPITGPRNKIIGVRVTKKDATKVFTMTQLELEKSYNKHYVN